MTPRDLPGSIEWVQTSVRVSPESMVAGDTGPGVVGAAGAARAALPKEEQVLVALRHDEASLPNHMSIHIRMGGASVTDVSPSPST